MSAKTACYLAVTVGFCRMKQVQYVQKVELYSIKLICDQMKNVPNRCIE